MSFDWLGEKFGRFAIVGAIGFVVDAVFLSALVSFFHWDLYSSRAISFGAAVTTTWLLNRRYTFKKLNIRNFGKEYIFYIFIQISGSMINLAVYVYLVAKFNQLGGMPIIPLALGSVIAMLFNYSLSKKFVFNAV